MSSGEVEARQRSEDEPRTFPLSDVQPALDILCHANERCVSSLLLYFELQQHYVGYHKSVEKNHASAPERD